MAEVVDLAFLREERRLIWVCNCGCTVHRAYADGAIRCADCEVTAEGSTGEWRSRLPDAPEDPKDVDGSCFKVVSLDGPETFLKRRLNAGAGDVVVAILIDKDGGLATYSEGGKFAGKQARWLGRRLAEVRARLIGNGRP